MKNTVTTEIKKTPSGHAWSILVNGVIWAGGFDNGKGQKSEIACRARAEFMMPAVLKMAKFGCI